MHAARRVLIYRSRQAWTEPISAPMARTGKSVTTSHRPVAWVLVAALGFTATPALAQTPSVADGPWAGWVRCELSAQLNEQGRSYLNQQTHTWELTASTPTSGTDIKEYPATWTVVGGGTGQRQEGNGRTVADKWNTSGQPMSTTISFRVDLTGALIIALRGAQLASVGAMTGQSVARSSNGNVPDQQTSLRLNVDEYACGRSEWRDRAVRRLDELPCLYQSGERSLHDRDQLQQRTELGSARRLCAQRIDLCRSEDEPDEQRLRSSSRDVSHRADAQGTRVTACRVLMCRYRRMPRRGSLEAFSFWASNQVAGRTCRRWAS